MKRLPLLLVLAALLAACGATTTGVVDTSRWSRWINSPPEVVVVRELDRSTELLLRKQVELFVALVEDEPSGAGPRPTDPAGELARIKAGYPAKGRSSIQVASSRASTTTSSSVRRTEINVPSHELWDKYRRTIEHTSPTNLHGVIGQLEVALQRDRQDLSRVQGAGGSYESQVNAANLRWLEATVPPLIASLRRLDSSPTPVSTSAKAAAREAWAAFENTDLPILRKVMDTAVLATATPDAEGRFTVQGKGRVMARVKVAGRELYFPADRSVPGVRFFDVR